MLKHYKTYGKLLGTFSICCTAFNLKGVKVSTHNRKLLNCQLYQTHSNSGNLTIHH